MINWAHRSTTHFLFAIQRSQTTSWPQQLKCMESAASCCGIYYRASFDLSPHQQLSKAVCNTSKQHLAYCQSKECCSCRPGSALLAFLEAGKPLPASNASSCCCRWLYKPWSQLQASTRRISEQQWERISKYVKLFQTLTCSYLLVQGCCSLPWKLDECWWKLLIGSTAERSRVHPWSSHQK